MLERQRRKVHEAVTPYLEPGETIEAVYIGQTPIPPIVYFLVLPIVFIFILKFRTVVATDRHVYVFANKWMRTYEYSGDPYKVPIDRADYDSGSMFARVDGGPKLWVMPFGPVKKALDELTETVRRRQSIALPGETGDTAAKAGADQRS